MWVGLYARQFHSPAPSMWVGLYARQFHPPSPRQFHPPAPEPRESPFTPDIPQSCCVERDPTNRLTPTGPIRGDPKQREPPPSARLN